MYFLTIMAFWTVLCVIVIPIINFVMARSLFEGFVFVDTVGGTMMLLGMLIEFITGSL